MAGAAARAWGRTLPILSREPLSRCTTSAQPSRNYFIFGHYHARADMPVGDHARLVLLGDWITAPNWLVYDAASATLTAVPER